MVRFLNSFVFSLGLLLGLSVHAETTPDPAAIEFFESKIRPVLAEHCYSCHSQKAEKIKGGLYLDTKEATLKGGDSGPSVVPGDPDKSLLIQAVRYKDENLQMPPKGKKLSDQQIADLETWVKMGAPDPRSGENKALSEAEAKRSSHWAFKAIAVPAVPEVKNKAAVRNEIDSFVVAKLEQEGLEPSPPADKRTFLRRATFDLLGLAPTSQEINDFLADESAEAYAKVVDRLLAAPQYGERWARHWLDVARYADTKGYVFEEERRYPYSYTYRDYVIRSFNEDLPFDRFIVEQLAADQLELSEDKRALAAMGYLTLGRRFLNNQADIIDDRIDVVTRGFMGLTVVCARCHDHKYDPIPTKDYYSLYGVFSSSHEPQDKPLLGTASLPKDYPAYQEERKKREDELENFRTEKQAAALSELRSKAADYLLAAYDSEKLEDKGKGEALAKERKLDPRVVRKWVEYLEKKKSADDPILRPWFAFAALAESNFVAEATQLAQGFRTNETSAPIHSLVAQAFATDAPASMKDVAKRYETVFTEVEKAWTELKKSKAEADKLPDENQEKVRQLFAAPDSPLNLTEDEFRRLYDVPTGQKLRALRRKLEELDATHSGAPPKGMVLNDNAQPTTPRVFVRGNASNPGPEVPRQFLELIAGPDRKPFQKGSGRLELAQAIASKDNPLTARVAVNRVWLHHFGAGLVRTPSDFGVRADPPSHPELLDYLAAKFISDGWSLKKLHRFIMLSATYRQASDEKPAYVEKDPNNMLLWRMNRRRLEFEPFRDTLLQVSGRLDSAQYGQPVDITTKPFSTRRSIYAFIERQNLPGMFRTFDFASPDSTSPQRFNTTVPQQALFMINSPFVTEQARFILQRPEVKSAANNTDKIKALYLAAFQREPTSDELNLAEAYVAEQQKLPPPEPPVPAWQYGYGRLDPASHRVVDFKALPHFTGNAWQGGDKLPHEKLGWLLLNAEGGHPGEGLDNVIVRRWVAPADMVVSIEGRLKHDSDAGDGVRGRIISSRSGEIAFYVVRKSGHASKIERLEVKKGETIDFVVDSFTNLNSDSFTWAPRIKALNENDKNWAAKDDFSGPKELAMPLNAWEKFAQVILMSNELAFVD